MMKILLYTNTVTHVTKTLQKDKFFLGKLNISKENLIEKSHR